MNQIAEKEYKASDRRLTQIVVELKKYYTPEEIVRFDAIQKSWEVFRLGNAEFESSQYEGGTIKPLIYFSVLESTTTARLAELEGTLEQFKLTVVPYAERNR